MTARFGVAVLLADAADRVRRSCGRVAIISGSELSVPKRYRVVTVHDLEVSGHRARAIVRSANGYPIGVSLVASSAAGDWMPRRPKPGTGHGQQVSATGIAVRVPDAAWVLSLPVSQSDGGDQRRRLLNRGRTVRRGVAVAQTAATRTSRTLPHAPPRCQDRQGGARGADRARDRAARRARGGGGRQSPGLAGTRSVTAADRWQGDVRVLVGRERRRRQLPLAPRRPDRAHFAGCDAVLATPRRR